MTIEWTDPVFQTDAGWFFYDECWSDAYGPFENEEKARTELHRYCEEFLGI